VQRLGHLGGAAGADAARARADDGDFVSLKAKHNFSMAHLGMALGMLRHSLVELQVQHCNDFFAAGGGALSAVACLPRLRVLRVESLHCRADRDALAELAQLRGVRAPALQRTAGGVPAAAVWPGVHTRVWMALDAEYAVCGFECFERQREVLQA